MHLRDFQRIIEATYGERDRHRGIPSSVAWLTEEIGELAQSLRKGNPADQAHEFADVIAWTVSLANQADIDLEEALERYAHGCPVCGGVPCACEPK